MHRKSKACAFLEVIKLLPQTDVAGTKQDQLIKAVEECLDACVLSIGQHKFGGPMPDEVALAIVFFADMSFVPIVDGNHIDAAIDIDKAKWPNVIFEDITDDDIPQTFLASSRGFKAEIGSYVAWEKTWHDVNVRHPCTQIVDQPDALYKAIIAMTHDVLDPAVDHIKGLPTIDLIDPEIVDVFRSEISLIAAATQQSDKQVEILLMGGTEDAPTCSIQMPGNRPFTDKSLMVEKILRRLQDLTGHIRYEYQPIDMHTLRMSGYVPVPSLVVHELLPADALTPHERVRAIHELQGRLIATGLDQSEVSEMIKTASTDCP